MTDEDLKVALAAHTEGQTKFTRRMAIHMAHMADLSPKQLVLRLERIGLLKRGAWRWFERNGGISQGQIAEVLGDAGLVEA